MSELKELTEDIKEFLKNYPKTVYGYQLDIVSHPSEQDYTTSLRATATLIGGKWRPYVETLLDGAAGAYPDKVVVGAFDEAAEALQVAKEAIRAVVLEGKVTPLR